MRARFDPTPSAPVPITSLRAFIAEPSFFYCGSADALRGQRRLEKDLDADAVGVEAVEGPAAVAVVLDRVRDGDAARGEVGGQAVDVLTARDDEAHVVERARPLPVGAMQGEVVRPRREVHVVGVRLP